MSQRITWKTILNLLWLFSINLIQLELRKLERIKVLLVRSKKSKDLFDDDKTSAVERFDSLKIDAFKATFISI